MKKGTILFCFLGLIACNKEQVRISGRIVHAEKQVLHLDEVDVYKNIPTDSVILDKKGKFSFSYSSKEAGFYQLRLTRDKYIVLFPEPGQHIEIQADANNLLASLDVSGSHGTEQITKLIRMLSETRILLDSVNTEYKNARSDTAKARLNKEYQNILERHRKNSIAYILTNYNSLSCLYVLYQQYLPNSYVFYKATDMQFFKIISDSLEKYYPGSRHVKALRAYTDNMISRYKSTLLMQSATSTNTLPKLALPDMAGDTVNLTSFKGRYVLLVFWASYDENSVNLNLELKKIYQQYRKKGFEIVEVSFDNSPDEWKRAVRYDELPWISLIDESYPKSTVAGNYNVTSIPASYLIAKDNTSILAKNLTPVQLRDRLQELLK
jgi:peroxiredoxin